MFEQPRHDQQEDEIIDNLMQYMTEEFLQAGISVVFDTNVTRLSERRALRDFARKLKAEPLLVWLQIDIESAFMRVGKRDRRRSDDRYTSPLDRDSFEQIIHNMQNPAPTEDYVVLSGKHTFRTQMQMLMKKLLEMNLIESGSGNQHVVKPGLVNLVPGRVDASRRNITIR